MFFNSLTFPYSYQLFSFCNWFVTNKNLQLQNILLLLSSYFFYALLDWRFLFLLIFSTFLDYYTGIEYSQSNASKQLKNLVLVKHFSHLGFLGFFKYYNFFAIFLAEAISHVGLKVNP